MPTRQKIVASRYLGFFGRLLQDPRLWHLNRRSVAGGAATGLFCMFNPPLGQMLLAAAVAIRLRVSLPIAVGLVWLTNPLTMPPIYYLSYRLGAELLGRTPMAFRAEFWLDPHNWLAILAPLLLGNLIFGSLCALVGYFAVQAVWRWRLLRQIRERRQRYQQMLESRTSTPSSNRHT